MTKRNQPCPCGSNTKFKKCCGSIQISNEKPESAEDHYRLGRIYIKQNILENAVRCFQKAIELKLDYEEAYLYLGVVLRRQNKTDEAIDCFLKTLSINPLSSQAHYNLALAYRDKELINESLQSMQSALKNAPEGAHITGAYVTMLNTHMPKVETDCPYVNAQKSLQQIDIEYEDKRIGDKTVRELYQHSHRILSLHQLDIKTKKTQLYRGTHTYPLNCSRHWKVFKKFNAIPEYCFDCYKILIEPRTAKDLFKLLMLFSNIKLPNDNLRKCIVEDRQEVSGTYKGFIYCKGFDEGKEIMNIVQPILEKIISKNIPITLKRGCSEFPIAHPAFGFVSDNKNQHMIYNKEWRKHEEYIDENIDQHTTEEQEGATYNHQGLTLLDALVMRKWLEYAAKIGDKTCLNIEPNLKERSFYS